jgi:MFS-type transporter involved in bile tolerance (Atg22 family)
MEPTMKRAATAIFWPIRRRSLKTSMMGKTKIARSIKKCVSTVLKKNSVSRILQTAWGIVLSQYACTGRQRKMVMNVRTMIQIKHMVIMICIGSRIDDS